MTDLRHCNRICSQTGLQSYLVLFIIEIVLELGPQKDHHWNHIQSTSLLSLQRYLVPIRGPWDDLKSLVLVLSLSPKVWKKSSPSRPVLIPSSFRPCPHLVPSLSRIRTVRGPKYVRVGSKVYGPCNIYGPG